MKETIKTGKSMKYKKKKMQKITETKSWFFGKNKSIKLIKL